MGSKRKIQINNKRNKKNKKTRKQKGGFGLDPLSMIPGAKVAVLQLKLMKAQMNLQVAFFKTDPTKTDQICDLGNKAMTEINSILKEPELNVVKDLLGGPLNEINDILNDSSCPAIITKKIEDVVEPLINKMAAKISGALPNILKNALNNGAGALKPIIVQFKSAGAQIPIDPEDVESFINNPFVQKVLKPTEEASEDSGDSGAASTGDSGAASTGSSSAPGSQFKDDPEKGVELAKKKIAIHKEAKDEAKVAKYKKSLEKYEAMVSGGGGTKRNKKNKKRKTIKIKCL